MEAFYAASREGFEYAFAHPDEAIALTKRALNANFTEATEREKLKLVASLMLDQDGKLADWALETDRIKEVESYLQAQGQLKELPAPESFIKNVLNTK